MAPQLYLITPATADPDTFPPTLMGVLSAAEFSAILVQRGTLDAAAYSRLAASVVNIGQGAGCAVLLQDDIALAKQLNADGVHITGGVKAIKDAVATLKPSLIVGAGHVGTRHEAMTIGEMNVDYVFFGPLDDTSDPAAADLAAWWAATFEIPAVLSDPGAVPGSADSRGTEFLALSSSLWSAPAPAAIARAIAEAVKEIA